MKIFLVTLSVIASLLVLATPSASALAQYGSGSTGVDVSWPNCSQPLPNSSFRIVGVSDGTGYSTNHCLSQQVWKNKNNLSYYVNTGWNILSPNINSLSPLVCGVGDENCLAYNYGYNAGVYALHTLKQLNLPTDKAWWLDVETSNSWSSSVSQNQDSIQGEYDALMAGGASSVGIYSTTVQWQVITGGWKNGWPSWGSTTWTTASDARTYCTGHQFTGGPSLLMQYLPLKTPGDQDVAC
ncbi:MAG TPA: hypothetical protein VFN51_02130 [Candidatus Saccharimonadales bacterium]|nr:hypothetical protein [Candidatus Saccharimonadales bacterium]